MLNNKRKYKERSESREPSTHRIVNNKDSYVTLDKEFLNEIAKPGS